MKKKSNFLSFLVAIVILTIIILLITLGITYYKNKQVPIDTNGFDTNQTDKDIIQDVQTYNTFFNINNIINKYFNIMSSSNNIAFLNILFPDYVSRNEITDFNANNFKLTNYKDIYFYAKKIYQRTINNTIYYFVDGDCHAYEENNIIDKKMSFVVVIDVENTTFAIMPIEIDDIYLYTKNYNVTEKTLTKNVNNNYDYKSFSDKEISQIYLKYYKNIIYINSEKAYQMFGKDTKKIYPTLENFSDNIEDIYELFAGNITNYSSHGLQSKKTFIVSLEKGKVYFEEKSIMNFEVNIINSEK